MNEQQAGPKAGDAILTGDTAAAVSPSYGLQQSVLSPLETMAQSISLIAPSTTPALTVPLVFALSGTGSVLAYVVATAAMLLVALCVASFARESASPGSLYSYVKGSLPPFFGAITAWALFFSYVMTAASVMGGFLYFCSFLLLQFFGTAAAKVPPSLIVAAVAVIAVVVAYRDIRISARLMMLIESISVCLIGVVIAITLWKHGMHLDASQFRLRSFSPQGVRMGGMLAIFSFVGFESATTLGSEARDALRTIPRAVISSTLLVGVFFLICVYGEVLGFHGSPVSLTDSTAPFHYLSSQAGISFAGWLIDIGVLVSMFAATLACVIAASRVLLQMSHDGLAHRRLQSIHARSETPGLASLLSAFLAFLPVLLLAHRGVSGADIYGWMGTLAVFGFLTAYTMVAIALAVYLKKRGRLTLGRTLLAAAAALAMLAVFIGNIFPLPPAPYRYFPALYLAYMVIALLGYLLVRKREMAG